MKQNLKKKLPAIQHLHLALISINILVGSTHWFVLGTGTI